MACNCSKRARPTGTAQSRQTQTNAATARTVAAASDYTLRDPKGVETQHGSRLEAAAARVRAGGGTIIPPR